MFRLNLKTVKRRQDMKNGKSKQNDCKKILFVFKVVIIVFLTQCTEYVSNKDAPEPRLQFTRAFNQKVQLGSANSIFLRPLFSEKNVSETLFLRRWVK